MAKARQCGATTKKGVRCKNPGNPDTAGLCGVHSKGLKKVNNLPQSTPPPRFERIKTGAAIFGGVFGGTAGLIKVVGWVIDHWPEIEQTFRIIMPNGRIMYYREWREYAESHQSGRHAFIDSFERWYSKLPHHIRHDAQREFGNIPQMIASARSEVAR